MPVLKASPSKENVAEERVNKMTRMIKTNISQVLGLVLFTALGWSTVVTADTGGEEIFEEQCQSCHKLSGQAPDT